MPETFLRRQGTLISKLGKRRKKKQKWRRPTGRHNKMREKIKGHPSVVSIGRKKNKFKDGKNRTPARINSINELRRIKQGETIIIGKVGKKRREEILKMAKEKKIVIYNKYLKDKENESK